MEAAQIKHMVERFLGWRLPQDFNPDAGISFKPTYNDSPEAMRLLGLKEPSRHEPSGTNLFDATQAEGMVRFMVEDMPYPPAISGLTEDQREEIARIVETVAKDGLPGARDLDVALDAIQSALQS